MKIIKNLLLLILGGMLVLAIKELSMKDRVDYSHKIKIMEELIIMQNDDHQRLRKKTEKLEKIIETYDNILVLHDKEIMSLQNKGAKNGNK